MRLPFTKTRPADAYADTEAPAATPRATAATGAPASDGLRPPATHSMSTSTRRRLMGALVLLVAGVVGFPLLFESKPRPAEGSSARMQSGAISPAPGDNRPASATLAPPPVLADATGSRGEAMPAMPVATGTPPSAPAGSSSQLASGTINSAAPAPNSSIAAAAGAAVAGAAVAAATVAAAAPPKPAAKPAPQAAAPAAPQPAARVVAEVAPKPPAAPKPAPAAAVAVAAVPAAAAAQAQQGRFVVQVGAFADPKTLGEARQRVEKLGLKTYTQEVATPAGKRTRVRVGPFASRDLAQAAANKLKAGGIAGAALLEL